MKERLQRLLKEDYRDIKDELKLAIIESDFEEDYKKLIIELIDKANQETLIYIFHKVMEECE